MGRSGRTGAVLVAAVLLPATTAGAFPDAPTSPTPDTPITLVNRWGGASTLEGRPPEVLVGVTVTVGRGGRAGTIRLRASHRGIVKFGPRVTLPATPGTHTFGAPHLPWDDRTGDLGLVQSTGGHMIVVRRPCAPGLGRYGDPCQVSWLDWISVGGVSRQPGQQLALDGVIETDRDRDLRGDRTEDRTDLAVTARPHRGAKGSRTIVVHVRNRGPQRAGLPRLAVSGAAGRVRFRSRCAGGVLADGDPPRSTSCTLAPLAVGATRRVVLELGARDDRVRVRVDAEGTDPVPGNDAATAVVG